MTSIPSAADQSAPDDPASRARTALSRPLNKRRVFGLAIWLAAFVGMLFVLGLPTDPVYAFIWLWALTIAWHSDRPWRSHLSFARDWVAVVVLLVLYNVSRGVADKGIAPHVTEMIHADEKMFGWLTGGVVPTVYLQQHLYHMHVQWYDVLVSFVYFSHFVTALVVAVVLWLRNRDRWSSFIRRFITLNVLGLATYFLYPAAPPWWASDRGFIQPTYVGLATRGWSAIGLHGAGNLLNAAKIDAANPVAAMPSLHSAYALLVVVFFMPTIRKRWWPLLLAYPLAMTFTLVYSGEHYMTDVLVGWFYVLVTMVGVAFAEKRWAAWRERRVAATGSVPTSPAPVPALAPGLGTAPALTAATATTAATPTTLAPATVPVRPNAPPATVPVTASSQATVAGSPASALDGAQPASANGGSGTDAWSDADDAAAEIAASVASPMRANGLTE